MTDTIKISRELRPLLERITFPYTAIETVYVERQIAIDELRALLAQPAEPQGGEDLGEVVHIGQVSLALLHMNKKGMCSVYGHAYPDTVPLMTVAQHRRLMAEQLERERGVVEALRLIAGADPLVVTPKYRIAASEALAAWERNHGK